MGSRNSYHDNSMFKGAPTSSFEKARWLRKNMTLAEKMLWKRLKNKQVQGYRFRRQHPIHLFIVDFYCHELGLIIEVDGEYHNKKEQLKKDRERTELLKFQDLNLLRFTNKMVLSDLDKVMEEINEFIQKYNNPLTS